MSRIPPERQALTSQARKRWTETYLQRAADARGEIAIGIRRTGQDGKPGGGVELNPGRDERLWLNEDDEIIVLTT